jgi:hypothetical protein
MAQPENQQTTLIMEPFEREVLKKAIDFYQNHLDHLIERNDDSDSPLHDQYDVLEGIFHAL